MDNEKYEQKIREILLKEFKSLILYFGNLILDDTIFENKEEKKGATIFWEKLQRLCL